MLPTLHDGAKEGNLEAIQELLKGLYIDVNVPDKTFGKTPIRWAVQYGQLEVAEFLLNHKARLDVADAIGRTPLLWAARYGHTRTVQFLLDKGDSVERSDNNGRTALSLAAREGYLDVVELLIRFGSEVDSKNVQDQTPLSFAAMNGHLEVVLRLLDEGANPELRESSRNLSPLSFAAKNRHRDVVLSLIARNCQIDTEDSSRRTSLSWAVENGDDEIVRTLLEKGANVNSKDKDGRTPLSFAAEFGHTAVAKLLLQDNSIEYDIQDTYYDQTPLSWAAEGGHDEIVGLLLEKDAEADSRDRGGHTPLLWAIRNGRNEVVELLLQKEVDVIAKDEDNWTPLSWAAHRGKEPLTRRLLTKAVELDAKIGTAIAEAIEDALWRANKSLLDAKEELERAKKDPSLTKTKTIPNIPLFGLSQDELKKAKKEQSKAKEDQAQAEDNVDAKRATLLEYEKIINLIINDEYIDIRDYKKRTLLSWAAEKGHYDVLKLLLSTKQSPNSIDELRRTPISWAAREGHQSTVVILLDCKVHPDWRDGAGRTPLSLAAERGHEDVVRLLLDVDDDRIKQVPVLPLDAKKKPAGLHNDSHGSEYEYDISAEAVGDFKPENGVDFDSRDDKGQTPLLFAAKGGHGKVVSLLLEKGANIDIKVADDKSEVKSLWQFLEDEINSPRTDPLKAKNLLDVRTLLESSDKYGQLLTTPMVENVSVDSKFMATIVQFLADDRGKGCGENLWRRCSVLELINGKMTVEGEELQSSTCKWVHVPANNVSNPTASSYMY
jgi:ankyrin repeat protein